IRDRVARIDTSRCPLFLLSGEYDYSCTPEETLAVARSIPGCEVTIMKGLGHFPMSEDPQTFLTHLLPVLEKIVRSWCRATPPRGLFARPRRWQAFLQGSVHLGHGRAPMGIALAAEPLLVRAEIRNARLDLGLEVVAQIGPREQRCRLARVRKHTAHGRQRLDLRRRHGRAGCCRRLERR